MNQNYPVPYYYYPVQPGQHPAYPTQHPAYPNKYLELGKFGAVVGLCGAGATNLRRLQRAEIDGGQALTSSLKTGLYAGLATATATATASIVADRFQSPTASLLATVAAGTAVMYALNSVSEESPHE